MVSPNSELRRAIIERFNDSMWTVTGYVDKNTPQPYAILGDISKTGNDNKSSLGYNCVVNFYIYSSMNTWVQVESIEDYIIQKITLSNFGVDYVPLLLNGFTVMVSRFVSSIQTIGEEKERICNLQLGFDVRKC